MRKANSTNSINEDNLVRNCGVVYALSMIGGRWKPAILFSLLEGKMRYNELLKSIPGVSERMLVAQLRELEAHGLVNRIVYAEVPPRVEYELTALGRSAEAMLLGISGWGNKLRLKQEKAGRKTA
ncbi:winged helix-turn-helix transcriptional regulator [Niabella beijingensis]|uniref:winged helix-turn-helix transcriptional regulator n=1 Tax=Niabella beijingensis TaxID=2872700 RepID=UPI001CC1AA08|nr:helix-turn-helix domain-containing protein [Niabella beijingensis]MBZ4190864.1 helix-turn-helix transcriptional regulator [Niabella beijingensis]